MKDKSYQSIVLLQKEKRFIFDVYVHYIEWDVARLIWIAFYKNEKNKQCFIRKLPKDLVKYILSLLGRALRDNHASVRPFIKI